MTHEHDIDVLLALADAGADAASPEVAERLDHCAECLEDLRFQLVAVAALREATPPTLSEHEAHRLRRGVSHSLEHRSVGSTGDSAAPGSRARRAWSMLAGAAAVTLAVAVGAPILGNVLGGGDDMDGSDDSFAATQFDSRSADPADSFEEDMSLFTTEVADDELTTMAADGSDHDVSAGSPHAVSGDLALLQDLVAGEDAEGARDKLADTAFQRDDPVPASTEESSTGNQCAVEGSLMIGGPTDSFTLGMFELDADPDPVVVTVHVEPSGVTTVIAHDAETCDILMATS